MPMYVYRNLEETKEVEVLRDAADYDQVPTLEESGMSEEEYAVTEWKRILQPFKMTRGENWNGRKGEW